MEAPAALYLDVIASVLFGYWQHSWIAGIFMFLVVMIYIGGAWQPRPPQ